MRIQSLLAGITLTLIAGACSRAPQPTPTPMATPSERSATPVVTPVGLQIRSLELGRAIGPDKRVTEAMTSFRPSDTVYVAVLTEGSTPQTRIDARFVFGPGDQPVTESSQTIASAGPAVTEFHAANPSGWPRGAYAVDVSLAGGAPQRIEFKVE